MIRGSTALGPVLLAGLALGLGLGCSSAERDETLGPVSAPTPTEGAQGVAPVEEIEIERVQSLALQARVAASGTIEARRLTHVGAEVRGRIVRVLVDVGDDVEAGAPLFQIDPVPFRMAVAEARAALALASAESANADAEARRMQRLVEQAVASKQRWDQQRTLAEVARARAAAAQARLDRARRDLERTEVRSPYAASVVERRADEGTVVGVEPILVIQERGALQAILDVPEATPVPVRVGDAARLFVEGLAGPIEVTIDRVAGRVDPQTRTYEVRADVADPDGLLKAGSYARAELFPTRSKPMAVVAATSVLNRDGRSYVLRVEDGVVHHVPVRVGIQVDERAEILSGVSPGEWVVSGEAVVRLANGTRVIGREDDDAPLATTLEAPAPEEPGT